MQSLESSSERALNRGKGRGPIRNLRQMAVRLHWVPTATLWRQGEQCFGMKLTTKSTGILRATLQRGLDSGLASQTFRQLKLDGQSQKDSVKSALNAALGGVWHETRANSVVDVGEMCVRCGEAVEDLEHIVHHCPAWLLRGARLRFRPPPSKRLL
eukprot:2646081-Amphidinium_carterae.1